MKGAVANAADLIHQVGPGGSAPLGTVGGDINPTIPANYRGAKAVIYARNLSAIEKHRVIVDAVSFARGGEIIQEDLAKKGQGVSLDKLHERALNHNVDLSKTDDVLLPVVFLVEFNGRKTPVPFHGIDAVTHEECDAPRIIVPEGAWDLYCGNYDLLHYGNAKDREGEIVRLRNKWGRYNRVFCDDFPRGQQGSQYAYVEFIREPIPEAAAVVDTEELFPGMLVEV